MLPLDKRDVATVKNMNN